MSVREALSKLFTREGGAGAESVDLLVTWHPYPSLISFAFRPSEVKRLLLDWKLTVALTLLVCFLSFRREWLIFWLHVSVWCFIIIIIIIIKKDWQCKAGRGRLPPYQSEDPSPTLPTYRGKEEKGKIVEDKKVESN